MGKKFALGLLGAVIVIFAIAFVLKSEHALVAHPKGIVARKELELIGINYFLMFLIIIPTLFFLFLTIWRYHAKNRKAKYDPDHSYGVVGEVMLWVIPAIVVAIMATITWKKTHELDPYKPLDSALKPLAIQVVAIDWKWLFIYPEQGIATLNHLLIPEKTPIQFSLAADGSPMNSFWIPQLSGQIYAMAGMVTHLNIMADEKGVYSGRASEINGEGLADMTFVVESTGREDFDNWVEMVKKSQLALTSELYQTLAVPSMNLPVTHYGSVEPELFNKIVMKYMHPSQHHH